MAFDDEQHTGLDVGSRPKVLAIHLALLQYPILGDQMRQRMREELFARGVVQVATFEQEAKDRAIASQRREGIADPLFEESEERWQRRLKTIRDILTEFYFGQNLRHADFQAVVHEVLSTRRDMAEAVPSFNPEVAPWNMLFEHARHLEQLPPERQQFARHQLREITVVLTKGMLSDQLSFVGIARDHLAIHDLEWIHGRRIGRGKIGGKAGGMMLAQAILYNLAPDDQIDFREVVSIPDSHFLGSDPYYEFLDENGLSSLVNFKYRPVDDLRAEYPRIRRQILAGRIPDDHRRRLADVVRRMAKAPIIVRSSSLLEDNFGIAFAGKYDSFFCPNQGSPKDNLEDLCRAVKKVYASVLSPDAIMYRQHKELIDYDERMGVLIQRVEGKAYGKYFFPSVAGVAFSHNPLRWSPRIDRSQGFLRMVTGLGTHAVDRLDSDYAHMVALSHPTLRPSKNTAERIQYAQKMMDVINLEDNRFESRPVSEVLDESFPDLPFIASLEEEGSLRPLLMAGPGVSRGRIVVTFDGLLRDRAFPDTMKAMLAKLERHYRRPVDVEFAVQFDPRSPVGFRIRLLQCRQQSRRAEQTVEVPTDIDEADVVLRSGRMVSNGRVSGIEYVVYVDPERYRDIADADRRHALARAIGELNGRLAGHTFILVGPGRWGSSNIELGVPVMYGDIFHARLLVEVALSFGGSQPEASYGTHFFQDLVEADILPLPIYPDESDGFVRFDFFRGADNCLVRLCPTLTEHVGHLKVIDVPATADGKTMEVIMNDRLNRAVGYLRHGHAS
ncbi:MAG: PEP/pyruvate-binding domain-containing protein [Deltaproteobacteria bacterium]|jgi:hypothetical protein|nr:PEP/pyruvate-binding domain-containing protein [Deltaproteobacteria bacterium]MBW2530041.1 PEP/pyruvate-binding domain-containing protein [Deltaproteobacteria bacterium]